jgi:hypothetical protein
LSLPERRFPSPWTAEETDACFIVRDVNRQALAYVYCEDEPGRRAAAKLLTRDGAPADRCERRQVAGVAIASGALPNICHRSQTKQSALLNDARALQISSFSLIAPLAVGLALSGCTAGQTPLASSEAPPPSAGVSIGQRDLTPEEKKVIMDAVAQSLRNPGSAKYHWAKFPAVVTEGSVNYCATVDAQSPYAAYNGRQAYVVEAQISGNRVSSAVVGLVAGGKDFAIVTNMCAKYGLDPRNAS